VYCISRVDSVSPDKDIQGQASTEQHIRITLSERGSLFVLNYLIADVLSGLMVFDPDGDL
jgi:hypothetical protein